MTKLVRRSGILNLTLLGIWYDADTVDTFLEAQNAKIRSLESERTDLLIRIDKLNGHISKKNNYHAADLAEKDAIIAKLELTTLVIAITWPIIVYFFLK